MEDFHWTMLIFKTTQTASKLGYNVEVQNRFAQQCCPLCKKDLNARFRVLANNFFFFFVDWNFIDDWKRDLLFKKKEKKKTGGQFFFFFQSLVLEIQLYHHLLTTWLKFTFSLKWLRRYKTVCLIFAVPDEDGGSPASSPFPLHFLSSAFRRKYQRVESRQHTKWRPHDEDKESCSFHIQTTKRKRRGLRMLETLNYEISNMHSIVLLERSQGSLYKHTITQIHLHTHIRGWNDYLYTYWHGKHNPTTLHSGCHVNNVYNPNPSPFLCWVLRIVSFFLFLLSLPPSSLLWHALTVEFCLWRHT